MRYVIENALEVILSAVIVAFLIFILVAGNINGSKGLIGAINNNAYNKDGVEDKKGLNTEKDVSITSDALSSVIAEKPENFTIKYLGGTKKTCHPDATGNWTNLYEFRDMITVVLQEPKAENDTQEPPTKEYKYDKANDKWLVKSNGVFVSQDENDERYFYIYVIDIKNIMGKSVMTADSVLNIGDETPTNVFYDDDTDTIACFVPGAYSFDVKITEKNTSFETKKRMSIPFEN